MIKIVHELRKARGTNAKREILAREKDNLVWKQTLAAMYDESINYHIGSVSDMTFIDEPPEDGYEDMFLALEILQDTKIYTAKYRKELALQCSTYYGEVFRLILGRSLKAKVAVGLINGAYPGLIPTWDIMKGKDVPVPKYPVIWSIKYDGIRLTIIVKDGTVDPRTTSGKHLQLDSLKKQMVNMPNGVYEGELVYKQGKMVDRPKITSLTNKILLGTAKDGKDWNFHIFDKVSLKEWDSGNFQQSYLERLSELKNDCWGLPNVLPIFSGEFHSPQDMEVAFIDLLANGWEGFILRYPDDPYIKARTETLIKKKAIKECTVRCTGVTGGTGKYQGLIGALHYTGEVEGVKVQGKVGSGLSEYDVNRESEDFAGKDIELLYNSVTLAKGATTHSLFLPRFKRIVGEV